MEEPQAHYNLIMLGNDQLPIFHASSGQESMPADRFLCYTDEDVKARYIDRLDDLSSMPALVMPERGNPSDRQPFFLTRIANVEERGKDLRFLYEHLFKWSPAEAVFNSGYFGLQIRGRGVDERYRTHWAVKEGNLVQKLLKLSEEIPLEDSSMELSGEQWNTSPTGPVCVSMPSSDDFAPVYDVVQRACNNSHMEILQLQTGYAPGTISSQFLEILRECSLVISDLTGANPNVQFEAGMAVGSGKEVILLIQDSHNVPTNLADRKVIRYLPTQVGLMQLLDDLEVALRAYDGAWKPVPLRSMA